MHRALAKRAGEQGVSMNRLVSTRLLKPPACPKCGTAAHWDTKVFTTRTYERAIRKLLSEADRRAMEAAIVANPRASPVIRGTGGLRKERNR